MPTMHSTPAPPIKTPGVCSFLLLAPEIRNDIYGYCTPVNGHRQDYEGLFLSCKQIRAEYEGEAAKVMARLLDRAMKEWRYNVHLRIDTPGTHPGLTRLIVELPISAFIWDCVHLQHLEPIIISLLQLHISELAITFYKDQITPFEKYQPLWPVCRIINDINTLMHGDASARQNAFSKEYKTKFSTHARTVHTRRLIVRWGSNLFEEGTIEIQKRHFAACPSTLAFAKRAIVKSWNSDPRGFQQFELRTSTDDPSASL